MKNLETTILGEGPETMAGVILEPIMSGVGGAVPSAEYLPGVASICQRNRGCSCTSTRSLTGWAELARCSDISIGMCPKTLLASPKEFRARICRSLQRWSKIISFSRSTASPGKPAGGAGKHLWRTPRRRGSGVAQYGDCARGEPRRTTRGDGQYLIDGLRTLMHSPWVGDVRGKGMLVGVELVQRREKKEPIGSKQIQAVVDFCRDDGLIVRRSGGGLRFSNTITLSPPLVITRGEIDRIVETLDRALAEIPVTL